MSSKTFHSNEELLEVLCERHPNIPSLSTDELNLSQNFVIQGWSKYLEMLHGPIYPLLVKEFWKNASAKFDGSSVSSIVFGNPITITPATIAAVIGCTQTGVTVEGHRFNSPLIENANTIFDLFVWYQPTNLNNFQPIAKVWFELVLSNFRPRGINLDTLTHDDRLLIHLLVNRERVNLPQTIFNHLRYSIVVSREEYHSFIHLEGSSPNFSSKQR